MKKFAAIITALAVMLGCLPTVTARDLTREEIPVSVTEVNALKRLGIMKGTDKGMEAERPVTRAEAVVLVGRTACPYLNDLAYAEAPFSDIEGHWAQSEIEGFCINGLVEGRGGNIFDPDGVVTGREFTKILLSAMGCKEITLENAAERAKEIGLLYNDYAESAAARDFELLRSDCARLCYGALAAEAPDGEVLYKRLISEGVYAEEDFDGIFSTSFSDRLNAAMPKDENYMFSPYSIKTALALAANGAEGETQKEILDTCGIESLADYNNQVKSDMERYGGDGLLTVNISDSVWLNSDNAKGDFSEEYKFTAAEYYGAAAETVTNETAVKSVNDWVSEKTDGKIEGIISSPDFLACLVNAVYFKGTWLKEFFEENTQKDEFTDLNGKKTQIDFMNRTNYYRYCDDGGVQIIALKYINDDGSDVSMYVLMGDGIVENPAAVLENAELVNRYVRLSLPKFKTEFDIDLTGVLKELGINKAFSESAEFGKMFDRDEAMFSGVLHKTYINVDEHGTEAAAATAVMMGGTGLPPQPVEMNVNRPFSYIIRDDVSGEILFMGQYSFAE